MKYLGKIQEAKDLVNVQYVTETVQNAINALDKADSAVDGKFVTAVSQENGTISVTKSQLEASDIPTLEISKINGLQSALDTNSQAISTETSRAESAEAGLLGSSADGEDTTTIYGARKLASIAQNLAQNAQKSIGNMYLPEVSASTGQVIGVISQTNGKVNATVKTLEANDIPEIPQSKVTNLTTTLAGKQDTLVFQNNNYDSATNKAVTNSDLQAALGGLSGAMHFRGAVSTLPGYVEGYNSGDVIIINSGEQAGKEFVCDGTQWVELGDETSYAVKGSIVNADISANAAIEQSKIANLVSDLASKATSSDITAAIQALDVGDAAVSKQFVTQVSETDGKISVVRRALTADDIPEIGINKVTNLQTQLNSKVEDSELATIAKTGDVTDLIQQSDDVIILYCGTSTELV